MKNYIAPILLLAFILFAEIVAYRAFISFFKQKSSAQKKAKWCWIILTLLMYITLFLTRKYSGNYTRNIVINLHMMILVGKFVMGLSYVITRLVHKFRKNEVKTDLSRREFASKIALGTAAIPLGLMNWGIFRTAYNFRIHRPTIQFPNLPSAFDGIRIAQLSDIHTGSLQTRHQLQKAVDMVMDEKPDMIVFTGDIVNNRTDEAFPYIDILQQLKAPMGVFSILGNHDYGEYETWSSEEDQLKNMEDMFLLHKKLGWKLLLNEHVVFEKEGQQMALLGVENWGANLHFKKYGKLDLAHKGTETIPFKVLLSHDPSHFDTEVTSNYKDIDLTLSGHTHGFQFGIEIPGFLKWSPSQYIYKQWAGLYSKGNQYVYVNRGLGCLGYMGRIGILPEITIVKLNRKV